jgi:hypothetical protein
LSLQIFLMLHINAINVNKYFSRVDFLYELTFNIVF